MSISSVYLKYGYGKNGEFDTLDHEFRSILLYDGITVEIKSDYLISFFIYDGVVPVNLSTICIYSEDFEFVSHSFVKRNDGFETIPSSIYRDFLGYSNIRIVMVENDLNFQIHVKMRKLQVVKFNSMIHYLYNRSNDLLYSLLSATKSSFSYNNIQGYDSIEKILDSAEKMIEIIKRNQFKFKNSHQTKLIPQKIESWKSDGKLNISPADVMNNLDSIYAVYGNGDIFVRGRHFKIGGILTDKLVDSPNIVENKVILSGLYSVKIKLSELKHRLTSHIPVSKNDEYYISIDETIIAEINQNNMLYRIRLLIKEADKIVWFFEKNIGISLNGKKYYPVITPIVRSSNLYRLIFEELKKWYSYGIPITNSETIYKFFNKIKSVPKLFEYFVLFKIHESLESIGMICNNNDIVRLIIDSDVFEVIFTSETSHLLKFMYEPIIKPFSNTTQHLNLVDLKHKNIENDYNYYLPDFVLEYKTDKDSYFMILDAKFSSRNTIRKHDVLEKITDKYYFNLGIYDKQHNFITRNNILSIAAIYIALNNNEVEKSRSKIINQFNSGEPLVMPVGLSVPLDVDNANALDEFITQILRVVKRI